VAIINQLFTFLSHSVIYKKVKSIKWSMRLTQKKRYFHTSFVQYFEAVNYHTKKTKKTKQSVFHTDLVN